MAKISKEPVNRTTWFKAFGEDDTFLGLAVSSVEDSKLVLESISVLDGQRGKNVGGELLDAVKDWGREKGCEEIVGEFFPDKLGVDLEKSARRFYEKHNIQIDGDGNLSGRL